jgi:F1F0 ATPase subunit 2
VTLTLLGAAAGGLVLGAVHFGGLWLTVQRLPAARRPALLALGSFVLRTVAVAGGVVLLAAGDARRVLAALAGILAARAAAVHRVRSPAGR